MNILKKIDDRYKRRILRRKKQNGKARFQYVIAKPSKKLLLV